MPREGRQKEQEATEQLLRRYLEAATAAEEEKALGSVVDHVEPAIRRALHQRVGLCTGLGPKGRDTDLLEDLYGDVLLHVLSYLVRYRASGATSRSIESLRGLAAATAGNRVNAYLRERYPRRASLQDRVQYVLDHYAPPPARQLRFAVWSREQERLSGLAEWRDRPLRLTPRYEQLQKAPLQVASATLPGGAPEGGKLAPLLLALFGWLRDPLRVADAVAAVACIQGLEDRANVSLDGTADGEGGWDPPASSLTPEAETLARDHLRKVWATMPQLRVEERIALLLNLTDNRGKGVIDLFIALGICRLRQVAELLEMSAEALAELWNRLPLDDAALSERLACPTSRVAVLRFRARQKLNAQLAEEAP